MYCEKHPRNAYSLVFSNSSLKSNSAANGGFLYLSGCHVSMVYNVSIISNRAENGGGIYSENSEVNVDNSFEPALPPRTFKKYF